MYTVNNVANNYEIDKKKNAYRYALILMDCSMPIMNAPCYMERAWAEQGVPEVPGTLEGELKEASMADETQGTRYWYVRF